MTKNFGQLLTPNYSARTSFADYLAYSFAGFLLSLPFLPIPQIRFYFAVFTFLLYMTIFSTLAIVDFVRILRTGWQEIWQIQFIRIKIVTETV